MKLGQFTTSVKAFWPKQPLASVARKVTGNDPRVVGVPVICPPVESDKLAGNEPPLTVQVIMPMPPVCVSVWL